MAANTQLGIIFRGIDQVSGMMKNISNQTDSMAKRMRAVGKQMTMRVTLPLVGIGAAAVKSAMDLDTAMRNIQSITGQTDAEIAALSLRLRDMSTSMETGAFSAVQYAESMYQIESAGFAGAEGEELLRKASVAATAGLADLEQTVNILTGTLNAYGASARESERFTDVMFMAIKRGKTTMDELAAGMGTVAPLAAALGIEFEDLNAAITTITKQGISTNYAFTQIRATMAELMSGNEALTAAVQSMGYESSLAMVKQLGLAGAMQKLQEYAHGAGIAVYELFVNRRAVQGVTAMTGKNLQSLTEDFEAMKNAAGATADAFAQQTKSAAFQFKKFKAELTTVLIDIGNIIIPVLIDITKFIRPLLQAFQKLPSGVKTAVVAFLAFAAALGPILWLAGALIPVVTTLGVVIGFLVSPIGLVIAAAVLLGIGLSKLINSLGGWRGAWEKFTTGFQNRMAQLKENAGKFVSGLIKFIGAGIKLLIDHTILLPITIAKALAGHDTIVTEWVKKIIAGIVDFAEKIPGWIGDFVSNAINSIIDAVEKLASDFIKSLTNMANGAIDAIESIFGIGSPSKVMTAIGQNLGSSLVSSFAQVTMSGLQQVGPQIQSGLKSIFGNGGTRGGARGRENIGAAGRRISEDDPLIGQLLGTRMYALKTGQGVADAAIVGILNAFGISSPSKVMKRIGGDVVTGFYKGVDREGGLSPEITPHVTPVMAGAVGGDGNIVIHVDTINLSAGTPEEQAREFLRLAGKELKRRGFSGRSISRG